MRQPFHHPGRSVLRPSAALAGFPCRIGLGDSRQPGGGCLHDGLLLRQGNAGLGMDAEHAFHNLGMLHLGQALQVV